MKKRTSTEIRKLFLDFFVSKGHKIEESSSLIPKDDDTLLWINSGVAALKKYFDGSVIPDVRRIVNAQKSIRANDIENVGVTARHHTFFEMLGNFSIGDYFRQEAMEYAWEFLTSPDWVGFDPDKLYITVYPGDYETYDIWVKVLNIPQDHLVMCEDNFWEIGEGPCGPCTEIFYDRGTAFNYDTPKEELYVGGENDRYIEIWNVVFSQFNAKSGVARSEYEELPAKNIDTGMGLERMVSIIQGGVTNFDTDLFLPIIAQIEHLTHKNYQQGTPEEQTAFKLISDHVRTLVFAIADGALPSNEGRGYVIRRLLRRASRYGQKLGAQKPFLYELVDEVIEVMKSYYTYLPSKKDLIKQIIIAEEEKFLATLADGEKKLTELLAQTTGTILSGKDAFMLYDTYGFPVELTLEWVQEVGFSVDLAGFENEMQQQKQRARAARHTNESMATQVEVLQSFTEDSRFCGYETLKTNSQILLMVKEQQVKEQLQAGDIGYLICDQTPFYAESGGQSADTGSLSSAHFTARVLDVKKAPNGQHLHQVMIEEGVLSVGDEVVAMVDGARRKLIERNHTATHLLQYALRKLLGAHVEQAGSSVDDSRVRFDFTHFEAVPSDLLLQIETTVNEQIFRSYPVYTEVMSIEDAKAKGAMALFGEKYGSTVRVVIANESIELCGGTHVPTTAEIGLFKIVSESGIGSGVRRIEAVTSQQAYEYLNQMHMIVQNVQQRMKKKTSTDVVSGVEQLLAEQKVLQTKIAGLQTQQASVFLKAAIEQPQTIGTRQVVMTAFEHATAQDLKTYIDIIKGQLTSYVICLLGYQEKNTNIVIAMSADQSESMNSKELIGKINEVLGSRGGGKAELAQATSTEVITQEKMRKILTELL